MQLDTKCVPHIKITCSFYRFLKLSEVIFGIFSISLHTALNYIDKSVKI